MPDHPSESSQEPSAIASRLDAEIKTAMKKKDKSLLTTLRMAKSAIKQIEIDERRTLSDADVLTVLNRLIKQRQESIKQYQDGGRPELAEQEQAEITILQTFLPKQLSSEEIDSGIKATITELNAESIKDMGKVMQALKTKWVGQADMALVSKQVKTLLT